MEGGKRSGIGLRVGGWGGGGGGEGEEMKGGVRRGLEDGGRKRCSPFEQSWSLGLSRTTESREVFLGGSVDRRDLTRTRIGTGAKSSLPRDGSLTVSRAKGLSPQWWVLSTPTTSSFETSSF